MVQETTGKNVNDESKAIVKIAAKLMREAIRNVDNSTGTYPSTNNIRDTNSHVPELLKFFANEIVRSPVKQILISQTIL